jgi:hypothetical protein
MSPRRPVERRRLATLVRVRMAQLFDTADAMSVPLLRLMAATNDTRLAMKQIIRAQRGGRKPRNRAERMVVSGEQLYLVRLLCGHLEEAGRVFRDLWGDPKKRRKLRRGRVLTEENRANLALLEREFIRLPSKGLRERFLNPIRNDWTFHYLDHVFRAALDHAENEGHLLVAVSRGMSRYLLIDDLIARGLRDAAGGDRPSYERAVKEAVELAGALGKVVDALLLGLLESPGVDFIRRDFTTTLERALERGQREAIARGLVATRSGN